LLIRSISGLRGLTAPANGLTDDTLRLYAASFASYLGNQGIVALGFDGRKGGEQLYELTMETLLTSGCDVLSLDMVPTPTVMFAVEKNADVKGGISITASHNGQEWNGMKFIASSGLFLDQSQNESLWKIVDSRSAKPSANRGKAHEGEQAILAHIDSIVHIPFLAKENIRERKFKVVLDAVNASGSFVHQILLEKLGVTDVISVATDGTGIFPHPPEPVPQNLTLLCEAVRANKADLGIAVDPDADRCVLIMDTAEPFIEENTIVLAAEEVLRNSPKGQSIVVNLSTTRAIEDIAEKFGAKAHRTAVGEINVAKKMQEVGAIIGGEGSGGVIYPAVHTGRDSLVAVALALSNLARSGMSLSEKKKTLPHYEIVKSKIALESREQVKEVLAKVKKNMSASAKSINEEDGIRFDLGKSWLHVRASNTEPIIRLIAEARSKKEAEQLLVDAYPIND
jgi:phosphomannomutase